MLLTTGVNAQTKTGFDFFAGQWNATVLGSPMGDLKLDIGFEKINDQVKGSIKDTTGKELYEVITTEINQEKAILNFIGSQGEVPLTLVRKDDDNLTGNIMNMFDVQGVRIKDSKK